MVFYKNYLRLIWPKPLKIKERKVWGGIGKISADITRNQVWLIVTVGLPPYPLGSKFKLNS